MIYTVTSTKKGDVAVRPSENRKTSGLKVAFYCERIVASSYQSAPRLYKKGNHKKDQATAQDESSSI